MPFKIGDIVRYRNPRKDMGGQLLAKYGAGPFRVCKLHSDPRLVYVSTMNNHKPITLHGFTVNCTIKYLEHDPFFLAVKKAKQHAEGK